MAGDFSIGFFEISTLIHRILFLGANSRTGVFLSLETAVSRQSMGEKLSSISCVAFILLRLVTTQLPLREKRAPLKKQAPTHQKAKKKKNQFPAKRPEGPGQSRGLKDKVMWTTARTFPSPESYC
jgi:hypothetical protein